MKFLLVDDDPEIRLIVRFLLTDAGHDVHEAADAAAARTAFDASVPDVLLMDVQLGGDDGVETAAALLRGTSKRLPRLVFLTGATRAPERERMHAAGAAGILEKPFDPSTFVKQLTDLLADGAR